jgi:hypothetical protein
MEPTVASGRMRHNKAVLLTTNSLILNVFFFALRNEMDGPPQVFQLRLQVSA